MWQQIELALRQSAHRVLVKLASFLPGLVALLLRPLLLTAIGAASGRPPAPYPYRRKVRRALARNSCPYHRLVSAPQSDRPYRPHRLLGLCPFGCLRRHLRLRRRLSRRLTDLHLRPSLISSLRRRHPSAHRRNLIARFLARSVLIGAVNARSNTPASSRSASNGSSLSSPPPWCSTTCRSAASSSNSPSESSSAESSSPSPSPSASAPATSSAAPSNAAPTFTPPSTPSPATPNTGPQHVRNPAPLLNQMNL